VSEHVPVDPAYRLEPGFRYVEDYIRVADPLLRLRKSSDRPGFYVLERRCRRSKPVHTSRRMTDRHIQARDGYVHVSTVHRRYLDAPLKIVAALHEDGADLHRVGGAARFDDALRRQDADARAQRKEKRRQHFADIAAEAFDIQDRVGGVGGTERTRINNPGAPWLPDGGVRFNVSSTGESPVTGKGTDEHSPGTSHRPQDGELHPAPAV
jgi:hypothetical protein